MLCFRQIAVELPNTGDHVLQPTSPQLYGRSNTASQFFVMFPDPTIGHSFVSHVASLLLLKAFSIFFLEMG